MTEKVMQGKPYAGNPHVRFDEGAGAPARSGRSALLYKELIIKPNICMTLLLAVACAAGVASAQPNPPVRTDADRNATQLQVQLKKIGCLRPKSVKEVGPSNFTIDGAPVDRDFADFDKYRDYLVPLGVNKIRIMTGWAKSEREKGKVDVAWLDHIVD